MQLDIPSDILDIMRKTQYEHDEYIEFGLDVSINREGEFVIRDMMGMWQGSDYAKDMKPEEAWPAIRKWWANELDSMSAQAKKDEIKEQIKALQSKLDGLEETAKKRRWFW